MYRKKVDVDVINDVLKAALVAFPTSLFIKSLSFQYQERGGLSKKQLQGLHSKASKVNSIPAAKLATLEAEILKRPTRYKSPPPDPKPFNMRDEVVGNMIVAILEKSPLHKRVLFFKSKYENNEAFSPSELAELDKFKKFFYK